MPIIALSVGALMVILRAGASRVFFDVVGSFQADRLIDDAQTKVAVLQSLVLDGLSGIGESAALVVESMNRIVDATIPLSLEVENARIEFEKFANFADAAQIQSEIVEIGESFAFTADQALVAGARMAQLSGIVGGGAAVGAATEVGIQFGLIGGMDTETAMQRMINLQQQTGFMYGELTKAQFDALSAEEQANVVRVNSMHVLDQLNTVENRSAATMEQITKVMNQFAAQGEIAGDSITYMAAASATLIEAGEEQGKAGRALRMMYARLGANTGNNAEVLAEFGVAVKDSSGNLRSMEEIMYDLSRAMEGQTEADRMRVAQAIAGNDHYVRALKLMENQTRTMQLNHQAIKELDTAEDELARRMAETAFQIERTEAQISNLKAEIGDGLAPAYLRAKESQAAFIGGFRDLFATDVGGFIGSVGVVVGQYGELFGGFGEAYLNIASTNVALQAQIAIVRALRGEEIARADAYGYKARHMQAGATSLLHTRAILRGIIADESKRLANQQMMLMFQNLAGGNNIARVALLDQTILREEALLRAQKKQMDIRQGAFIVQTSQEQMQTMADQERIMNMNQEIALSEKLANRSREEYQNDWLRTKISEKEIGLKSVKLALKDSALGKAQKEKIIEEEIQRMTDRGLYANRIDKDMEAMITAEKERQVQIENQIATLANANLALSRTDVAAETEIAKRREQSLALMKAERAERVMRSLAHTVDIGQLDSSIKHEAMLRDIVKQVSQAYNSKSNAATNNKNMTEALTNATRQLANALGISHRELTNFVRTIPVVNQHFQRMQQQEQALAAAMMHKNNQMMISSGILGAMSMALTVFSDKQGAARAAAVLMMASMVPATIQMFTMTKQMVGATAGMVGFGTATTGAAVAVGTLDKAMKFLSKNILMISITVLATIAAAAFAKFGGKAEEAEAAATSFGDSISALNYDLDQGRQAFADYGGDSSAILKDLILVQHDLDQAVRIGEAVQTEAQRQKIQNLKTEEEMLQDVLNKTQALQLAQEDDETLSTIRDALKEIDEGMKMPELKGYQQRLGGLTKGYRDHTKETEEMMAAQRLLDEMGFGLIDANEDILALANAAANTYEFRRGLEQLGYVLDDIGVGGPLGGDMEEAFVGPIEAAKEAAFEFANAREEMFFGMSKGNLTGDMVKQVVNKGVETLINTTEVFMTNNFNGMTTQQAANEIIRQVERGLGSDLNLA